MGRQVANEVGSTTDGISRRTLMKQLLASVSAPALVALPFAPWRFVQKDGWILKQEDL